MPIIGSEPAASNASYFLNISAAQRDASIRRLASGSKLANPQDDPAGVAVSSSLQALSNSLFSASQTTQDLTSFSQTASGFLGVTSDQLSRMSDLAIQAQNGTLSAADRADLNVEYTKIRDSIGNQINNASFNGTKVFDTNQTVEGSVDGSGSNFYNLSIADAAGDTSGIVNSDISTVANAQTALGNVNTAIDNISTSRAAVNADISALNSYDQSNQINNINTQTANSQISDVDYATESTTLATAGILNQTSIAVLAQANLNRQNVLGLLR